MKIETNLSQEPVSTRKKETFVQCYILLYSIFLQKKMGIIVAVWQNLWFPHKIATIFIQNFHLPYKLSKAHMKILLDRIVHIRRQLHKIV